MFKTPKGKAPDPLEKLFERQPIALLSELRCALGVRSRTTLFLVLKALGYYTSYTHAGRYYTLAHIPCFDAHGLWSHGDVRFSKYGTLRATVVEQVRAAQDGRTHEELQGLLGPRVHDTLRSLVHGGLLDRHRVEAVYVYTDADPKRSAAQFCERRRRTTSAPDGSQSPQSPVDLKLVVDILVDVIRNPRTTQRQSRLIFNTGGLR